MALDPALVESVQDAVRELDQPGPVAQRMVAWLKALSDGEASPDLNRQFYDSLLEALAVPGVKDED